MAESAMFYGVNAARSVRQSWRRITSQTAQAWYHPSYMASAASSTWPNVPLGPPDPILGLTEAFNKDTFGNKVNLGVGAYRDDEGKPFILRSVIEAEKVIMDRHVNKEYASIHGLKNFRDASAKLALADAGDAIQSKRVATAQVISGTGGLRLAGMFLAKYYAFPLNDRTIHVPSPTWGNHLPIFKACKIEPKFYKYYDSNTYGLNFDGMIQHLDQIPDRSVVLLHACAHNPTGVDPTPNQWHELATLFKSKNHFPVFDMAYQGFASGNCDEDAYSVRHFINEGLSPFVIQSYSKNMGLYGERVGALNIVTSNSEEATAVESQLKILIRPLYSNPPIHGAHIVTTILEDDSLRNLWLEEMHSMAIRIQLMREKLVQELQNAGSLRDWNHIKRQIGMFCYSGLTSEEVSELINKYHIYLTSNGRISMAGVTSKNVAYLAKAMHEVTN